MSDEEIRMVENHIDERDLAAQRTWFDDGLVTLARGIAIGAHAGQRDKLGELYIGHVIRVAGRVTGPGDKVVAWLHDVLEDTEMRGTELWIARFPAELIYSVLAISHRRNEPRDEYYARIREDPRAVRVKLADIDDNTDPDRLARLDPETRDRLITKYDRARRALR